MPTIGVDVDHDGRADFNLLPGHRVGVDVDHDGRADYMVANNTRPMSTGPMMRSQPMMNSHPMMGPTMMPSQPFMPGTIGVDINHDGITDFNLRPGQRAGVDIDHDGRADYIVGNKMGTGMISQPPMSMGYLPQPAPMPAPIAHPMPAPMPAPMPMPMRAPMPAPMPMPMPQQQQWISNVARPQMTQAANPPVTSGNIQYGPSYSMQYQKRSTADKTAVKYTGFLPLEGVYEEDTCRIG